MSIRNVMARLTVSGAVSGQNVEHRVTKHMSGPLYGINASSLYGVTASSGVITKLGLTRQEAKDDAYAYTTAWMAAGYFRDLPKGYSVYLEPSYSLSEYDAPMAGFGVKREGKTAAVTLSLLNRHVTWRGFTPRLVYSFTYQNSTVALYDFERQRIELVLSSVF